MAYVLLTLLMTVVGVAAATVLRIIPAQRRDLARIKELQAQIAARREKETLGVGIAAPGQQPPEHLSPSAPSTVAASPASDSRAGSRARAEQGATAAAGPAPANAQTNEATDRSAELAQVLASLQQIQFFLQKGSVEMLRSSPGAAGADMKPETPHHELPREQYLVELKQTASSVSQLSGIAAQTAEATNAAVNIASSAASAATQGDEAVSKVAQTFEGISQSSRKIGDIISVIDGIAGQTSILALNAAVEAARAGEQGRGFAVVAGEVRALAERSAAAAKEISSLIAEDRDKVEAGKSLVSRASASLSDVVQSVHRMTDIMSEIAGATKEQSAGIGQVKASVDHLDQLMQQIILDAEGNAPAEPQTNLSPGLSGSPKAST